MGMIKLRRELVEAILTLVLEHGRNNRERLSEVGAATMAAGAMLMSSGMNDEQVRAMLDQAFEFSAPVRRTTEERWKREGFDPFAGEAPGKSS